MKNLNIYVTEKLRINKDTEISKSIEEFIDVLSRIFDWEELKSKNTFRNFLNQLNISDIRKFKYLYQGINDLPHKEKMSKFDFDYVKEYLPKFNTFSIKTAEKINDIISSNSDAEIILGNEDFSKYIEKYILDDKVIGFSITDESIRHKNFYITGII